MQRRFAHGVQALSAAMKRELGQRHSGKSNHPAYSDPFVKIGQGMVRLSLWGSSF